MRMPSETARFLGSLTAPRCAARPPALGSRPDSDDLPSPPPAASIRQNIPFPAAPPAHPGACQHWHDITDQSPIRPSSTTACSRKRLMNSSALSVIVQYRAGPLRR